MTAFATRRSDVITVSKTPRAPIGVTLAHSHCNGDGSPGVVVAGVSRHGPLVGMLHPGDRILSVNGCAMVAAQASETLLALSSVTLVVAPPVDKASCTTAPTRAAPRHALGAVNW